VSDKTIFEVQDQAQPNRFHLRMMFTTGMGVLSDGYSLLLYVDEREGTRL
jgi:hypothetical protein